MGVCTGRGLGKSESQTDVIVLQEQGGRGVLVWTFGDGGWGGRRKGSNRKTELSKKFEGEKE